MNSVAVIERPILRLSRHVCARLERWLEVEQNRRGDQPIDEDSGAGTLDSLLLEAKEEAQLGRAQCADTFLGSS